MEAQTRQSVKAVALPAALLWVLNALFVVKYGFRVSPWAPALIVPYALFVAGAIAFALKADLKSRSRGTWFLVFAGLALHAGLLAAVPASGLNVDRWSAIASFLDRLLSGEYPYAARTHLGQEVSGFPGLFLFMLPFHLSGLPGLFTLAALGLFYIYVRGRAYSNPVKTALLALTLFAPGLFWESAAKSELFGNMVLVLLFSAWAQKLSPGSSGKRLLAAGALAGALLSTRGVVLIPLLVVLPGVLRPLSGRQRLTVLAGAGTVLLLLFVPFIVWNPAEFLANNPFVKQSSFIPAPLLGLVLLTALGLGLHSRNFGGWMYWSGLLLWFTVAAVFLLQIRAEGFDAAFFGSRFDLSYFQFAVPFLTVSMAESLTAGSAAVRS